MQVSGTGNLGARVVFVSDTPTEYECRRGLPMLDTAGNEFDTWLKRTCRLTREDVWVTVLQREFSKKDREATAEEIERLWTEINAIGPDVIVPFGTESTRLLLGPWASMDLCYGLPHRLTYPTINYGLWSGTVLPIPHPGGVQYTQMTLGFEALAQWLREPWHHEIDIAPVHYSAPEGDAVWNQIKFR